MTPLDAAHAAMADGDDTARLRFFELFASAELFVLLSSENADAPRVFETGEGSFLLAFDTEDRLTAFAEGPAPYAAMSGRTVARMIGDASVGIGLNLGVAPSSYLMPGDAVVWLNQTLGKDAMEVTARPEHFAPPGLLPETLLTSLDARLAAAEGLARLAYLAEVTYEGGRKGHMLAFIDAGDSAQPALTRAIADAMAFSGLDSGEIDVAFLAASDPAAAKLAKVGLRFDLPEPKAPAAPGRDPDAPPKLR